jgi:phage-related tail protein
LATGDVVSIFKGRISGKQLFKNLTNVTVSVVSGKGGWVAGTAIGAKAGAAIGSIIPGPGTAVGASVGGFIGGLAGAFAGSSAGSKVAGAVLNEFIEDDADEMIQIIQNVFQNLAEDYLLNQNEADQIVDLMQSKLTGNTLRDMYAYHDRKKFARDFITPLFEEVVKGRERIQLPQERELLTCVRHILEEVLNQDMAVQGV